MKIINAKWVSGCLLNPHHQDGKWMFRVYAEDGAFTDYELCHSDLCVTITDCDAFFYTGISGKDILDHSPETLGIKEE